MEEKAVFAMGLCCEGKRTWAFLGLGEVRYLKNQIASFVRLFPFEVLVLHPQYAAASFLGWYGMAYLVRRGCDEIFPTSPGIFLMH